MTALTAYHWPGHGRELEYCIARAVMLSRAPELQPPLAALPPPMLSSSAVARAAAQAVPLRDAVRDHLRRTLEETRWVLGGPAGAAARLGLQRPTRPPLVKRLGLARPRSCRHLDTCQSVGSRSSALASRSPRRDGASRSCLRLLTGVCPDRRGSGTALAMTPSQPPGAQQRRQRSPCLAGGRLLPLTGGALPSLRQRQRGSRHCGTA